MTTNSLLTNQEIKTSLDELLADDQIQLIADIAKLDSVQEATTQAMIRSILGDPFTVLASLTAVALAAGVKIGRKQQLAEMLETSFKDKEP